MSMGHVIAPADQEDFLVAVFVCVFDHRKGNLLVFKEPNDVELTDVEFKAMPGGSHHVSEDRVLFEMGGFYGAASYNLQRDPSAPRGLRAASVGLIGANFETLQHHFDFLLQQAKLVNEAEEPSAFDTRRLSEHFAQHCHSPALRPPRELAVGSDGHAKVMAPQGSFLDLLARFEARVFVLWRFVMLRKRLVLLAAPPVGPACDMVAALCQLQVDTARIVMPGHDESMAPLFFVPLNSWQSVEGVSSYAACVTERIVEQKPKLHDAFIKVWLQQLHARTANQNQPTTPIAVNQSLSAGGDTKTTKQNKSAPHTTISIRPFSLYPKTTIPLYNFFACFVPQHDDPIPCTIIFRAATFPQRRSFTTSWNYRHRISVAGTGTRRIEQKELR
eukprot:m.67695 g.67695  ORF g.67695 m.67695 type:complete len:388 (+) comp13845_c0_seq3:152-1315(+)